MFKAKQKLTSIVVACVMMIACVFGAIATLVMPQTTAVAATESYSYTFDSKQFSANGTKTLDGVNWTLAGDGGHWQLDSNGKGQQFGSSSKPYKTLTLTSDSFNAVTKIVINTSGATDIKGSFIVKVGGTQVGNSTTLTKTATDYTFTPPTALTGAIVFSYTQTSSKALYIKSISVEYGAESSEPETPACSHENTTETTVNATCTTDGKITVTCNECGETVSTETIEALGHTYGEANVTKTATCEQAGEQVSTCGVCGDTKTESINKIAHSYNANGVCTECGAKEPLEATLTFDSTSKRLNSTATKQVWTENSITLIYEKGNYNQNLGDYYNPMRFYAGTQSTISSTSGNITKIVFACNTTAYADTLQGSIKDSSVNDKMVTIEFAEAQESFTFSPSAQVRIDSLTVYCEKAVVTDPLEEAVKAVGTGLRLSYSYTTKTEKVNSGIVVDTLDRALTGINSTSYAAWSGKSATSNAVYAGQSAGSYESIQLRSNNNNSGIITTASGGKATKITVVWESHTEDRTLNIYGSNTAYTATTDLYDDNKQGKLLGTIVCGTSTELVIDGDYAFIGLRSASGAMYLSSIEITWDNEETTKTVMDTSNFYLACGVNASLLEVMKDTADYTYYIEVTANSKTETYESDILTTEDGMIYVVLKLDDMFKNLDRFTVKFSVKAVVTVGDKTYETSTKSLSVADMIKTYFDGGYAKPENGLQELYEYLVKMGKMN